MAAPIRRVAPNAFIAGPVAKLVGNLEADLTAAERPSIHASLSAFGAVVSSTVPGILHRSAAARSQIRRGMRLG